MGNGSKVQALGYESPIAGDDDTVNELGSRKTIEMVILTWQWFYQPALSDGRAVV